MNFKYCYKQYTDNPESALNKFLDHFMQFRNHKNLKNIPRKKQTTKRTN